MGTSTGLVGSPPRMWGTPGQVDQAADAARFTPTHVGNTILMVQLAVIASVHPHACGEHGPTKSGVGQIGGSPPRMWGTLQSC